MKLVVDVEKKLNFILCPNVYHIICKL